MTNINTGWHGPNVANAGRTAAQDYDTRYATALKLFSGEVYTAFNNASIAKGLVRSYSLRGGKSKQFLFTGKLATGYHTPGTPILGDDGLKVNEKTIVMDDLLVSSQFVYDLDEVLAQYNTRSEIPSRSARLRLILRRAYLPRSRPRLLRGFRGDWRAWWLPDQPRC